jgi:hypothetical protein
VFLIAPSIAERKKLPVNPREVGLQLRGESLQGAGEAAKFGRVAHGLRHDTSPDGSGDAVRLYTGCL